MKASNMIVGSVGVAALLSLTGGASAELLFSLNYKNLDGDYNNAGSVFTANAADTGPDLRSGGFVSRNIAPGSTASFEPGFVSGASPANFNLTVSVFNRVGLSASGLGVFTAIDADGDILSGSIVGDVAADVNTGWRAFGPFVSFAGNLQNVQFTPAAPGNTTFDGTLGGGFDFTNLAAQAPYTGALVQLFINTGGGFFTQDFNNIATEVSGQIIPTPGAMAIMGLGGLVALRRRR